MRTRLFEISAVLAGVAIVLAIYFYRQDRAADEAPSEPRPVAAEQKMRTAAPTIDQPALQSSAAEVDSAPVAEPDLPAINQEELEQARSDWQSAVAELEAVEAGLGVLDDRFDAKEAELSELEAQGMDPDALEEEMLIFLDGIVDEYDALESRLAEAEAVEADAAERLAGITGSAPDPENTDEP